MELLEKEWFIEAPWGRLSLLVWGNCWDPPVLLCHGGSDSAATFRPLVKLLPRNYYYIGLELPGNGKSDWFPPGLLFNVFDLLYALRAVVLHFRWKNFIYLGHSLGTLLGKFYNLSYPGEMTQIIDLDPTPTYKTTSCAEFPEWYRKRFLVHFKNYEKNNSPKELAPKYTRKQALNLLVKSRDLTERVGQMLLDRITEYAGDGHLRFTLDQRFKIYNYLPFPAQHLQDLYTSMKTPTLAIMADDSVRSGHYKTTPFALSESMYPHRNYRCRQVVGNHDVHLLHPERLAHFVSDFLLYGLEGIDKKSQAKL